MSADFRLTDPKTYRTWYGKDHVALDLQKEAVYGLTEHNRKAIAKARPGRLPGLLPDRCAAVAAADRSPRARSMRPIW